MRKWLLSLVAVFLCAPFASAQFTSVSAVVEDPSGNIYAGCRANASFVPAPTALTQPLINGSVFPTSIPLVQCDSFGNMAFTLADNNQVSDGHSGAASQWRFNITSQDGKTGFSCTLTITGATQVITAALQACAAPLPVVTQPASLTANNTFTGNNSIATLNGSIWSVKAFGGAKGDGVTNDFTAIQNTINAVQSNSGGTVYFPCGNYFIGNISTPLQFTGNGSFGYGENWIAETPGCASITVGASPTASWVVNNSTPATCIAYLNIVGLHFVAAGATIGGIDYNCVNYGKIHQNWFSNFNGVYIKFEPVGQNTIEVSDNRLEANFETNGQGFLVLADWIHSERNNFGKLQLQPIVVGSSTVGPYKFESGFDHFFHCKGYSISILGQVLGYRIHDDSEELDSANAKTNEFGIFIGTAATNPNQVSIVNWDAQPVSGLHASYQVLNNTTSAGVLGLIAIAGQNSTPTGLANGIQTNAPTGTPAYQAGTPGVTSQGVAPYIFNFSNQGTNASFFGGHTYNFFFDGTNWHTKGDGANNGGWGFLGTDGSTGQMGFYTISSTGTTDQTITNGNLAINNLRATLDNTGFALKVPLTVQGTPVATATLTLKKGSGSANYTNATTTYAVVDSTNLCYTVTIPTGWKLGISASGAVQTATAPVGVQVTLTDNASCSTANAGILVETGGLQGGAAAAATSFALDWVITGDGNSHNIALQFKTTNAADTASMINSGTILPMMKFELMPSN